MSQTFDFTLNGERITVAGISSNTSLLEYLRATGRTGSKEGCNEGDCGACTVLLDGRAVNSCIMLLPMVAGREVISVEGLHDHPVQSAMVEHYGSQCGYCTPGFICSMAEGHDRLKPDQHTAIADQLCGNLCRCTGYRPIRDAMVEALRNTAVPAVEVRREQRRDGGVPSYLGFHRPTSLTELFTLMQRLPEAKLVAGATEIGVDINKKSKQFPLLISTEAISELKQISKTNSEWRIGGAATLTEIEEALAGEYPVIDKMLWVFASRQIRNRATLAGNLVTASPIGDTPPVLLALDAKVELASVAGKRIVLLDEFFVAYRKTAMKPGEVLTAILLPRNLSGKTNFYKVSKRRELDISTVAAAFRIETEYGKIKTARLAYGGVAPMPVRARKTEAALLNGSVADALAVLREEFQPISDARGSAEYRRGLIVSLFEKFLAGEESLSQDKPLDFVCSRSVSFCAGKTEAHASATGKDLKHDSAIGHVTGGALYVDDEAARRPMLEVWPVFSPHAHAKILRRDASAALKVPGVVTVLMAEDVPGLNDVGVAKRDEILFADKEVMYHGHLVAAVVGESREACRRGAEKFVVQYEPLPATRSIADAIRQEQFHTDEYRMARGDCSVASAKQIEGEFAFGGQEHFYLETHAAWAECGDAGDIFISSSTQHPSEIQAVISHVMHLPRNKIVVEAPRMGGGFGGKETQGNTFAAIAALGAWKTKKPVRVRLDRDVDMMMTGKRHPFLANFKVGFDDAGKIQSAKVDLFSDGGWSLDLSMPVLCRALFHLDNAYYLPNVAFAGRVCKTNMTSHTAFRGFGGPQGMLVIEEIMDRVARQLGLPPEVVRERNLYHGTGETNTTHYGEEIGDNRIQTIWQSLKQSAELEKRRREIAEYNRRDSRIKRGIAITPVKFGISFTKSEYNQAGALVLIYQDGTVQVNHGGTEMGQGLYTKMLGVACRELGVPAERVRVMKTRTDKVPNTSATAASSGADLNGAAVRNACETLRTRLAPVAAKLLKVDEGKVEFRCGKAWAGGQSVAFEEVTMAAYQARVQMSATGYYATPNLHFDFKTGKGNPFHYFACGAAVTEVEVDGYSGMSRVMRVDILHDVGDSLNPGIDRGQIEGGFAQGMGWLTREELLWDDKGRLATHSASTYQIPAFSDAPADFRVTLLPEATQHNTIHGSKAVGEPPFMLAISVREAIRDAVAAFGKGGEVRLASPATCEAVFVAIQQQNR
ncbi:MAG: xanthine dehydrogenase molybdopterin binding subunit [Verrucomicrobiota bacterium]